MSMASIIAEKAFELSLDGAIRRILKRRLSAAREILMQELDSGGIDLDEATESDECATMIFEYARAAQHGAARRNLRLLAQVMRGTLMTKPLYPNEFMRWSKILSDLSREEIILLATLQKFQSDPKNQNPRLSTQNELVGRDKVFPNEEEFNATAYALLRTGLIILLNPFGGLSFRASPLVDKLIKFANIEIVLKEPD